MGENGWSELWSEAKEAEMLLIGIGEEMESKISGMRDESRYAGALRRLGETEEGRHLIPYVEKVYREEHPDKRLGKAYEKLAAWLDKRNFFILSLSMDDEIYRHGIPEERVVTPCGGFRNLQCEDNCRGRIEAVDERITQTVRRWLDGREDCGELSAPVCDHCGRFMVFNNKNAVRYAEEGYLRQWERYKKWLQGTVNRKLFVLELGAGMKYPSVIRWPFEKIVFFNEKSSLLRVHGRLPQVPDEIRNRGRGIQAEPVEFLEALPL